MTSTEARSADRYIGGEASHRSFFGGTQPQGRIAALGACFVATVVLTPLLGVWGLAIGVGGALLTILLTQRTHRGSILERRTRQARWRRRVKLGTDRFTPYDDTTWTEIQELAATAKGRDRAAALRELAAMRAVPDGADGMGWLQFAPREPGIAWHAPVGEPAYLSVAFSVTGQMNGVESESVMRRSAEAWGAFLASRASPTNLVGEIQTLTRVLPADSAMQEFWVLSALDEAAPADAIRSYDDVLHLTGEDAMVQRHFITVRWPLTPTFFDAAAKHGHGRDGWRGLMRQEIAATLRGLNDARVGKVEALTARRVAAVILHQQNPSRPIDLVADTDPTRFGIASRDEYSAHITTDSNPITGELVEWWHRTAAIESENMAMGARSQLWILDLLIGADIQFTRSVSFHLRLTPKREAKSAARADLTRDQADIRSAAEKGRLVDDESASNMTAAKRRALDLAHGSPHHGGDWVGFVTISETSRDALLRASRALEETCSTGLGIERLNWLDSYQAAASGTTWPIARGIAPATPSLAGRLADRLAGTTDKDAIS